MKRARKRYKRADVGSSGAIPRLRTADILLWLYDAHPETFTIRVIVEKYGLKWSQRGEIQRRVNLLMYWGAVEGVGTVESNRPGRKEVKYRLTEWGKRYAHYRKTGKRYTATSWKKRNRR
jgi:hypothetical protein